MSKYRKRPRVEEEVCVHAMSRVVQKRFLLEERGMEEMRRILRTQAEFAGLEVITFCFLENHFHLLLRVDPAKACGEVSDGELVRRFSALYGTKRSPSLGVDAEGLAALLGREGTRAGEARQKLLARMGNVSVFMRELKTRFTFWYNEHYKTVGTFWAERFRSVLVEPGSLALKAVAAYIDLNAVRAGLTEDARSYRFCGLGEACAGSARARAAYGLLTRRRGGAAPMPPEKVFSEYVAYVERMRSALERERAARAAEDARMKGKPTGGVEESAGAYVTDGGALGSRSWVERLCGKGGLFGFLRERKAKEIRIGPEEGMYAARQWFRKDPPAESA